MKGVLFERCSAMTQPQIGFSKKVETPIDSHKKEADEKLSKCMLSQVGFCIAGVAAGVGLGYTKKTLIPLVIGGVGGTAADFAYGWFVGCVKERELVNQLGSLREKRKAEFAPKA